MSIQIHRNEMITFLFMMVELVLQQRNLLMT
nr:MAG TPA: hypothetical protein [Caudoviricetes sp.]